MGTKKASMTNQKSRIIFFAIALTYNLLLGLYLKDFLVLSPMCTTFYLLSVLPTLFLLVDTRSKILRAVIYILFFLILMMNFAYTLECRRIMVFATIVPYGIELIYFFAYARDFGKDGFLTKIYVLAVSGLIIVTLVSAYNFVCKPEAPYFLNGGATLWDAQTALAAAGIKLYGGVSGSCDAAVENLLKGDLAFNPNVKCNHHDHNHKNGNHTCGSHSCGSHTCGTHNCN